MNKLDDDMHYLIFTDQDEKYPTQLSLWLTTQNRLWIECGPCDLEDQRMMMQGISLDLDDARALLEELTGIVNAMSSGPEQPKKVGQQLAIGAK